MKKRILSFIVLILVAVCGGIFVACGGGNPSINAKVIVNSGLDKQVNQEILDSISSELSLSNLEIQNLASGTGYDNSVLDQKSVSLIVDSQSNSSREIIVEFIGFNENETSVVFSSDSKCVDISNVEYISTNKAKVTLKAVSAGTAEIYVKTGRYNKTTTFTVKCIEKLQSFSVKSNAVIYLEKGKQLEINPSDYLNFYPSSSNFTDVEFFDKEIALTENNKTVLSTEWHEGVTGVISESKEISVKAKRLVGGASVQTISVIVVDSLSNLEMKKMVYDSNGSKNYVNLENNSLLTSIRNVSNGDINYAIREVFVIVDNAEENLQISAKTNLDEENILIVPTYKEQITNLNYETAEYFNLIDTTREKFSTWVYKFEFKYEGYSEYHVEFKFSSNGYKYDNVLGLDVEFKSASNMINLINTIDSTIENDFKIYDNYVGVAGSKFLISTNKSDEFSKAKLLLRFGGEAVDKFVLYDLQGNIKVNDNGVYSFSNEETFFIKAVSGSSRQDPYKITAEVTYTFENIQFKTSKEINLYSINSPTDFVFKNGEGEINSYNFDLNTSGKIISGNKQTSDYDLINELTLIIEGRIDSVVTGKITDFVINDSSGLLQIEKTANGEIKITAKKTGTGKFTVYLGNGISKDFHIVVINSLSEIDVYLPQANQNSNIISIIENYIINDVNYDQYAIVKNNSQIPLIIDYKGDILSIQINDNLENFELIKDKIQIKNEFNKQELVVKILFNSIDEDGQIIENTVEVQKILLTSITQIENFEISTNKSSNNFDLYDYSSVGYYNKDQSEAYIYVNILPESIKYETISKIKWTTNYPNSTINYYSNDGIIEITNEVFSFMFYQTGNNAGMGILQCNVKSEELFNSNGDLNFGKISLTASFFIDDEDSFGNYFKNIYFTVKKARTVEVIDSSLSKINLDPYSTEANIVINTYPLNSKNNELVYIFAPLTPGLPENAILIKPIENAINVKLNSSIGGEGVLRIIAKDSYSSASTYKTYLEIPVNIADGSEAFPYVISNSTDIEKMIETEFNYYYIINGKIDLTNVSWEAGKYVLGGKIIGKNNAKFVNYQIKSCYFNENNEYFSGLFKDISETGLIENVSFENISINLDLSTKTEETNASIGYIGLLAGRNKGTIKNVSVSIGGNENKIEIKDSYNINIGGVVGINYGNILTTINSNSKNTRLVIFENENGLNIIEDKSEGNNSHSLYVGGVVGQNLGGRIERTIEGNLTEFNDDFATAIVNIKIATNPSTTSTEGVGAVAGNNSSIGGGLVENPGIYGVSVLGLIQAENLYNVGGIVGNNSLKVERATSQVQVIGGNNVGGGVGQNSGELTSIYIENINSGRPKILIDGENYVGGIVGYMNGGQLTYSYFISYFAGENIENTDLAVEDSNSGSYWGLIVGNVIDGTINYVVAIADADSNNTTGESNIVSENYAIYSKDSKVPTKYSSNLENKTREELKSTTGFEFVFLPSENIDIKLTENDNGYWKNVGGHLNGNNNVGFFLYYFNSTANRVNEIVDLNFADLSKLITSSVGNKYSVISENTDVLEIFGGNLIIKKPGIAILKITSPYVADVKQSVYIKIVNYSNNISGYFDQNKQNEITSEETLDAEETVMLYFDFLDKYNIDEFASPQDINLLFVATNESQTFVIKAGETVENAPFSITKISYNTYQFVPNGTTGEYKISIIPYIVFDNGEVELISYIEDNQTIKSSLNLHDVIGNLIGLERNLSVESVIEFTLNIEKTTKSINLSKDSITTEPYYIKDVEVSLDSNKVDEVLTISVKDLNNNSVSGIVGISINGINEFNYVGEITVKNINCQTNGKLTFYFKMKDDAKAFDVTQSYIIEFRTSNGKIAKLRLNYEPQEVLTISSNLYPLKNELDNDFNFEGEFSYIPTGTIIPGQNSLIEFQIMPGFTYFDTIEIINSSNNQYNLLFDLYDRTNKAAIPSKMIENGISISRNLIKNGFFSLRTFADQRLYDNSYISIVILLKDKEGNVIGSPIEKQFYVEHLPGVSITIDGVSSGNSQSNPLLLAEGVKYNLDVNIKNYSTGNFVANGAVYNDGQIVFEIGGAWANATILKNLDGTYALQVNENLDLSKNGGIVQIKTYGINEWGEKSKESILYIKIVKFVVKSSENLGDIVKGVVDNVYASATGNTLKLEISLNSDILIYNKNNEKTKNLVEKFLKSLSSSEVAWAFKDLLNSDNWIRINSITESYTTKNGAFEITYNSETGEAVIKFKKTESVDASTLKIRFNAYFEYEDGIPKLATGSSSNKFSLSQEFGFNITEKTELRNPFPIYTYEQFLDMREGNYYILMNDITLPENFTPINTLIGGLDGNNYKINISRTILTGDENNTSLVFGIFKRTNTNCILKNIRIYVRNNLEISTYNYSSIIYGLLVGENNGIITNCSIEGEDLSIINLNLFGKASSQSVNNQVGGLVGLNYGDISNCRIETGISVNSSQLVSTGYLPANVGGMVAVNQYSGTITSSYVNARIENNSAGSSIAITGGFVASNDLGGKIFSSYTNGELVFPMSSTDLNNSLAIVYSASGKASGFVYFNNGEISNCYSNIPVKATASSGFVYQNESEGVISYCYSTSALQNSATNGGFVGVIPGTTQDESMILNNGTFRNCYYWEGEEEGDYNFGLGKNETQGLDSLTKDDFKNRNKFVDYAFSTDSDKTLGIWFMASASGETDFINNGEKMKFFTEIPQLVSPNILVFGHKKLLKTEYNEETDMTVYYYQQDSNYPEGSKYNPFIVASQEDLEYLASNQSGFLNGNLINCEYVRLVSDIIYKGQNLSGLYKYSFLGNIEGNSYTIGNYAIDSSIMAENGGFFATIGTMQKQGGILKNISFKPKYISLTNCNSVGAVAGTLYSGALINIDVDGNVYNSEINGLTILGKNIVGGIVGTAEGDYTFKNLKSNISVNSTYRSNLNGHSYQEYLKASISKISYSGLIAGVVSGYGKIYYNEAFGDNVSIAENAGLLFGYVGKNVIAEKLIATGSYEQKVKADVYGGVIAAVNLGLISNISIVGDSSSSYDGFFAINNYIPLAIGNIVGYMAGGEVNNATVVTNLIANSGVESLGGAVGLFKAGKISEVIVKGNISGGYKIGGVVGQIREIQQGSKMIIQNCFHSGVLSSTSSSNIVSVGTVIGFISNYSDEKSGGITVSVGEAISNPQTVVSIIADNDFINEIAEGLEAGEYTKDYRVITYSSSTLTEVWIGIAVGEKGGSFEKALIEHSFHIYNLQISGDKVYAPLSETIKINGGGE